MSSIEPSHCDRSVSLLQFRCESVSQPHQLQPEFYLFILSIVYVPIAHHRALRAMAARVLHCCHQPRYSRDDRRDGRNTSFRDRPRARNTRVQEPRLKGELRRDRRERVLLLHLLDQADDALVAPCEGVHLRRLARRVRKIDLDAIGDEER